MNLIIDIGNSVAKIAVFKETELVEVFYDSNHSLEQLTNVSSKYSLQKGIVASVITITDHIRSQIEALRLKIIYFNHLTPVPITNLYKTPETLGVDRLAAAVAANELQPKQNILIIDAGTCITYEFIDAAGCYHGGNISPGMQMRLKALNTYTDKLPLISPKGNILPFGNTTETAIRSGVIQGIVLEIEGYITKLQEKYPRLFVFLTGGDKFSFDTKIKSIIFADNFLVLKGLNRILIYNDTL